MSEFVVELVGKLKEAGIEDGDSVYFASNVTRLVLLANRMHSERKGIEVVEEIVEALKEAVGKQGIIMIPTFSWEFCRNHIYDCKKTKSAVGALSNYLIGNGLGFKRTKHPIYSFMVWGKDADLLCSMNNMDGWSEDSPFGYMYMHNTKMVMLDVTDGECNTFEHYVEKRLDVPWRYNKIFEGYYIDENGVKDIRQYSMFVRDLDIESTQNTDESLYTDNGLLKIVYMGEIPIRMIELRNSYEYIANDLKSEKNHIYQFENYTPDWEKGHTHPEEIVLLDSAEM